MLHELEKELAQVQDTLMKKEVELDKQQRMAAELELTIQEAKRNDCRAECGAMRTELQQLQDCLQDAKQQQRLAGEPLASAVPTTLLTQWTRAAPFFLQRATSLPFLQLLAPNHLRIPRCRAVRTALHSSPASPSPCSLHHVAGAQLGK